MTTTKVAGAVAIEIRIPAEMAEFASDPFYSPRMRVARVEQALKAWGVANETSDDAPDSPEGAEHAVLCLLADLRHYCDAKGLAFAPIDRLAALQLPAEPKSDHSTRAIRSCRARRE